MIKSVILSWSCLILHKMSNFSPSQTKNRFGEFYYNLLWNRVQRRRTPEDRTEQGLYCVHGPSCWIQASVAWGHRSMEVHVIRNFAGKNKIENALICAADWQSLGKTGGWLLQKLNFKFPLTVSTVHFICSTVGAYIAIKVLKVKPLIEVNPQDRLRRILPMSIVFCVNIVLGNVSLRYIPISFMQTIKSFTPATTGTPCCCKLLRTFVLEFSFRFVNWSCSHFTLP